jgi:fatty acid desaturase
MAQFRLLRRREDRRTVFFVFVWFTLVVLQWTIPLQKFFIAIPLIVATCVFAFLGAVATHNAMHVPLFRAKNGNRFFQVALTLVYGHPVSSFVPGHNLSHHRFMESTRDVMRTHKARFRWNLLNLLFFMSVVGKDIMRAEIRYARASWRFDRPWVNQLILETTIWLSSSAVLLFVDWRKFVLFNMIPNMYASWGILAMNMLQHDGADHESAINHSRNFVGKWVNWWTFNNGFHTIHHIDSTIHWSDLPAAHYKRVAPHIHPGLVHTSLLGYVLRTYFWPGKRTRFDGAPFVLEPAGEDEDWIANAFETAAYGPMSHRQPMSIKMPVSITGPVSIGEPISDHPPMSHRLW